MNTIDIVKYAAALGVPGLTVGLLYFLINHWRIPIPPPARKWGGPLVLTIIVVIGGLTYTLIDRIFPSPMRAEGISENLEIQKLETLIQGNIDTNPLVALRDADELIKKHPTYANGHRLKGNAYWSLQRLPEAVDSFTKAIEYSKDANITFKSKLNKAAALIGSGRVSEAESLIHELLNGQPNDEDVRSAYALWLLRSQKYEMAKTKFEEMYNSTTDDKLKPFLSIGLGLSIMLFNSDGKMDPTAIKLFRTAVCQDTRLKPLFSTTNAKVFFDRINYSSFIPIILQVRERSQLTRLVKELEAGKC